MFGMRQRFRSLRFPFVAVAAWLAFEQVRRNGGDGQQRMAAWACPKLDARPVSLANRGTLQRVAKSKPKTQLCHRHEEGSDQQAPPRLPNRIGLWIAALAASGQRLLTHKLRSPAKRSQSPFAEVAFGCVLFGMLREVVRNYYKQADSFLLRDELFQEMAVARTYSNSIVPWVQTGVIALVATAAAVWAIKAYLRAQKDWEEAQELREMQNYGEDSAWFLNTTITATPLEKKRAPRKKGFILFRLFGGLADKLWMLRLAACVGYILPLLNILDFGEISISLYPYPMGVPLTEPAVNFLQNSLKLKYLYKAYIKSGYYFLIVWFLFIQVAVRNKAAPRYVRFHSSQAILLSMLLGVPAQVFFAVLNPWESGLLVQNIMYHGMVTLFISTLLLIIWCCFRALSKKEMKLTLVSEAATIWAGKEGGGGGM